MKIEVNMAGVGEPTQPMWEFIWKIEKVLGITYDGPEEFKAASDWISEHADEYFFACVINGNTMAYAYAYEDDDIGYEYYDQHY